MFISIVLGRLWVLVYFYPKTKFMRFIVFVFLCFAGRAIAQQQQKIDSLRKVIASQVPDSVKAKAHEKILSIQLEGDRAPMPEEIRQLEILDKKGNCPSCKTLAIYYKGHIAARENRHEDAIKLFRQAAEAARGKTAGGYHEAVLWEVQELLTINKADEADKLLQSYLKDPLRRTTRRATSDTYFMLGILNFNRGYLNTAIGNYQNAEAALKGLDNESMRLSGIANNIAQVHRVLRQYDKAHDYVNLAQDLGEKIKDSGTIMNMRLHRGIIYTESGQFAKAVPELDRSYLYFKGKHPVYEGSSALYLGQVYLGLKQYKAAGYFLGLAEQLYRQANDPYSLAETLGFKARNDIASRKFKEARAAIDESKALVKDATDAPQYVEIIGAELDYYEALGDFKNALRVQRYQQKLRDALATRMKENSLHELEAKYQSGKKAGQIAALSSENQTVVRQKSTQLYIFLGILLLLVVVGWTLYAAYKNKIRTADRLRELGEMKSRFFANISHEFRTPITLIKSPLQTLKASGVTATQQSQLELIDRNANRMLELVNQLLELSRIDAGQLKLILKPGDLDAFVASMIEPFAFRAKEKGSNFITNIGALGQRHFDRDVLSKIVSNLLMNAFKHSDTSQPVYFSAAVERDQLNMRFTNSGTDLKRDEVPRLFERFYQKNESRDSSGIGLALVKELVDLYQGSVRVELDGQSLTFHVSVPLLENHPNAISASEDLESKADDLPEPEVFVPISESAEMDATAAADAPAEANTVASEPVEKPLLLLVDDHPDIRNVLRDLFSGEFDILEASDGDEAIKLARQEIPDCIISDIMMPKMNGLAFSYALKNDALTSFIPLVLLTAHTSEDMHLQALKNTADAFLTKPFNHDILQTTVRNLVADRRRLQERYSRELVLKPVDVSLNSVDEKFLDKLQEVVARELAHADFSAEDFAAALHMSRMQLHRKLKTLLGVSTTEFLRTERLKAAALLLRKGGIPVSEIAYAVGFNDLSYFSKCFKEQYGSTPSDYAVAG